MPDDQYGAPAGPAGGWGFRRLWKNRASVRLGYEVNQGRIWRRGRRNFGKRDMMGLRNNALHCTASVRIGQLRAAGGPSTNPDVGYGSIPGIAWPDVEGVTISAVKACGAEKRQ